MNIRNFLVLANKLDKQGNYKTSDKIFKFVEAQTDNLDEDPLGISNIQPSSKQKDPIVDKLRKMVANGEISEAQFWKALEKHKPGTFQNMLSNVGKAGEGESLAHTGWSGEMGYLRRGKWIRVEKFVSGRGEPVWVCETIGAPSMLRLTRRTSDLERMLLTLDLMWE